MKLSVIIPCYNFENYIEQSILSVLSQKTNFEFEILVRDDKSTDKSFDNIERYSKYVKILNSDENVGAARNIKTLIDNCRGEYIAYLDGDDYWIDIYKLQKQIDYMDSNPECVMTFTGYWMKNSEGYIPPSLNHWLCIPGSYENKEVTTQQLLNSNPATFGRIFRNINGLIKDWMLDYIYFDWVTNYELSKYGKIKYLDFPSGIYRTHNESIFSSVDILEREKIADKVREKLMNDYNS